MEVQGFNTRFTDFSSIFENVGREILDFRGLDTESLNKAGFTA